jgi:hypothetical protein
MRSAMIHDEPVATGVPGVQGRLGARCRRRPAVRRVAQSDPAYLREVRERWHNVIDT